MTLLATAIAVAFPAWPPAAGDEVSARRSGAKVFEYYQDIPGVTEEEIKAVEALKARREYLVYGAPFSTEAFLGLDGKIKGFSSRFCAYLSQLFGIEVQARLIDWEVLIAGMNADTIDFVGELSITPERLTFLFMTEPIAERSIKYIRIAGKEPIYELAKKSGQPLRYGFIQNSTIIELLRNNSADNFVVVEVQTEGEAYVKLKADEMDAFIMESPAEAAFDQYSDVETFDYIPILYSDVSLSTKNKEIVPIINVFQKALDAGIQQHLVKLYNEGMAEYRQHKFYTKLTPEEMAYFEAKLAKGEPIAFAAEADNYPLSFYNDVEQEFQGIALDIINDISTITGLTFKLWNERPVDFSEIEKALERGECSMVTELGKFDDRLDRFIWPDIGYSSDKFALISTMETPDKQINEVLYSRVGVVAGTRWAEAFYKWFQNHGDTVVFESSKDAFGALKRGDIDLFMGTRNLNISMTNYMEQSGFKSNLIFDYSFDAFFGFNKNEGVLCSLIEKAIPLTDAGELTERWLQKSFDYRGKLARSRVPVLFGFSIMLFLLLALSFLLIKKYTGDKTRLARVVNERTAELMVQTEEATQASRAKGDFLARMSHEIRTPMNAIIGMAELALRENPSEEISEMITNIQSASASLLSIINDILDFSKIESGKMELANSNYRVGSLIQDVINVISARILGAKLELFVELDANIPAVLCGDEVRFRQILLNLLSNAVKYSKEGYVTLRLTAELAEDYVLDVDGGSDPSPWSASGRGEKPESGGACAPKAASSFRLKDRLKVLSEASAALPENTAKPVEIIIKAAIEDTGIGIKPEDIGKLFGSFSQVNTEKNKGIEGTGLGLAISKNLALLMGGDITVESEYGKGSVFTVTIKQAIPSVYEPLIELKAPQKAAAIFLDSSLPNEKAIDFAMESLGARHVVTSDPSELKALLEQGGYGYIFAPSDASTQVMELKSQTASHINPVFFLGFGEKSAKKKGVRFVHKPLYCLPLAHALNEADEIKSPVKERKDRVSFIAPDAKALVVDDILINLKVAKGFLSIFKIRVDTAESGQQAIDLVKENNYDIIFMDHMMPGMDGIETTGHIRSLPEGQDVPIIALTANAITGVKEMFISNGLNDFISKPIERGKLETMLSEWLPKDKIKAPMDSQVA